MSQKPYSSHGDRIRVAIRVSGTSQRQLASELGIAVNSMSNYVTGAREAPTAVVRRIGARCGVSFEWLAGGRMNKKYGRQIEQIRLQKRLSRQELAIRIERPLAYVAALENGEIEPNSDTILDIHAQLGIRSGVDQAEETQRPAGEQSSLIAMLDRYARKEAELVRQNERLRIENDRLKTELERFRRT